VVFLWEVVVLFVGGKLFFLWEVVVLSVDIGGIAILVNVREYRRDN
jgi:hypothetical protein